MPVSRENSFWAVRNRARSSCRYAVAVLSDTRVCIAGYVLVLFIIYTKQHSDLSSYSDSDAHRRTLPFSSGVFHSPEEAFRFDYEKMEEEFKVFVYPDGDPETYFHTPRKLTGKYASEGYFFKNIRESRFFTDDPRRAHLFFLPISCHKMRGRGLTNERMIDEVEKYVEHLKLKYPYWNRTLGADHFFVTCHDIGVKATKGVPHLTKNSIRVACSSSYDDDDYVPHKDVTLPQVQLPFFHPPGENDIKNRTRVDLRATGPVVYMEKLYKSKFCLCPHGPVGNSLIADSIHFGCVPVIMSNYYDLPFNDILDWSQFSVVLKETNIYLLKDILRSISEKHFISLNRNIVKIQKHFKWNTPPVRQDAFHMVMYEIWLRRHLIRY
ncbi:hypothetical protein JHK87_041451 [Glycine soja]|nr:hypothetical protein JHK87_041451 [Glycine soja]